jgi:UDP-glucose 4-epimerase
MQIKNSIEIKKCLVIGGGGFIGYHVVKALLATGLYKIVVLGRSIKPKYKLPDEVDYIQFIEGTSSIFEVVNLGFDCIIDLAHASSPSTEFVNPLEDMQKNLPISVNLIEACRNVGVNKLIICSSAAVYGKAEYLPIDEIHPTNPLSPYGITKLSIEKFALMYHKLYNLRVAIVRPGNPYGPNYSSGIAQGFIGISMKAILNKKRINIFGENGMVRDYIYVSDLADGILNVLEFGSMGEVYNISSGIGLNNRDVVHTIRNTIKNELREISVEILPTRSFDIPCSILNSKKIMEISNWKPLISFEDGIKLTWQFTKNNF